MSQIVHYRYGEAREKGFFSKFFKTVAVWDDGQVTVGYARSDVSDPKTASMREATSLRTPCASGPRILECEFHERAPEKGIVNGYSKVVMRWNDGTVTVGYSEADSTYTFFYAAREAAKKKRA